MLLLRLIVRLIGVLWAIVLGAFGLALAAYCLDKLINLGSARPDRLLGLPSVRHRVGRFLAQVASPGPLALLALLCGVAAVLIGLTLLLGLFRRRKERLAVLEHDGRAGTLAARPAVLRDMSRALAAQTRGATSVKRPRVSLSRRGSRGRLTVRATRAATSDPKEVEQAVRQALEPLTDAFTLRQRVRIVLGGRGARVS